LCGAILALEGSSTEESGGKENQETQAKPQQIVTKTLLSCVQYLVPYLSHLQKI
jgi:hypothetical protein